MYSELFRPDDASLSKSEKALLAAFVEKIGRKYTVGKDLEDIRFQRIKIGFSPVVKMFSKSAYVYPYFIKVGNAREIQQESRNYGIAAHRIPPLNVPPLETYLQGRKIDQEHENTSLIAFRYITASEKTAAPLSLFYAFEQVTKYQLIEIIDELFQSVFKDLHSFHAKATIKTPSHLRHNIINFKNESYPTIENLASDYNDIVKKSKRVRFPHGTIHGDLHLENILLGKRLNPVIIDFGMLYTEGCLIRDFAEFEIAMLVAALFNDFENSSIYAKKFYSSAHFFSNIGLDRFSRAAQTVRANLCVLVESVPDFDIDLSKVSYLYDLYLLRYICSYLLIVVNSMSEEKKHAIVGYMSQIFEIIAARMRS